MNICFIISLWNIDAQNYDMHGIVTTHVLISQEIILLAHNLCTLICRDVMILSGIFGVA